MQVNNRVIVVTGGGSGIGRATVTELVRRGASVAAVDRSAEALQDTLDGLGEQRSKVSIHVADLTDKASVDALPDAVHDTYGHVDGLLNVAGIVHRFAPIAELTIDEIERVMAVNFWGTVYSVKAFLPHLLDRPEAALLNVASMGSLVPVPGQGAYGASKAAVKLFTETLFAELEPSRVGVSLVLPGAVATGILQNSGVSFQGADAPSDPDDAAQAQTTSPASAANQIVDAVESKQFRVLIGADAVAVDEAARRDPTEAIQATARQMRALLG